MAIDFLDLFKKRLEQGSGIIPTPTPRPDDSGLSPLGGSSGGLMSLFGGGDDQHGSFASRMFQSDPMKQDALSNAMIQMGAGMMAAGGPSTDPGASSFLGNLGKGMAVGNQAFTEYGKDQADADYKRALIGQAKAKQDAAAQQKALIGSLFGGSGDTGTPSVMPSGSASSASTSDLAGTINAQRSKFEKLYTGLMQLGQGDDARPVFAQMNQLDNEMAKNGMVWDGAKYTAAPGVNEGIARTEAAKVAGQESARKTDDIRNFEYGSNNPEFIARQEDIADSKRQANRLQKTGAYVDPKTNMRFNGYFDNATGNTIYKDATNTIIADPDVLNRMVEDSPGRTKANMSDPVVKKEREAEAALAQTASRKASTVSVIDQMQALSDDINTNSWFGTGGYNSTAKTLDSWLPGDNFSGSKRQQLDNLMQDQIKVEIDSMRGLGAMSDKDLENIEKRVMSGNLNPDALKEIGNRLRKVAEYNATKYEAWKASGQSDDFQNWAINFDRDNYSAFMEPPKQNASQGMKMQGEDGTVYEFIGGDPNDRTNWKPVQ
jgi:hypothetical protein